MKYLALFALCLIMACSNEKATEEKQVSNNSSTESKEENKTSANPAGSDIVGEWELVGFIGDTNDNLLLDEDERSKLKTASFKDYMKFNEDGTGEFTVARMEGRYESKPKEGGEKPYLTWYDKADGPHKIGTLLSVTKDELLIKEPGGSGLFLWKRL